MPPMLLSNGRGRLYTLGDVLRREIWGLFLPRSLRHQTQLDFEMSNPALESLMRRKTMSGMATMSAQNAIPNTIRMTVSTGPIG